MVSTLLYIIVSRIVQIEVTVKFKQNRLQKFYDQDSISSSTGSIFLSEFVNISYMGSGIHNGILCRSI